MVVVELDPVGAARRRPDGGGQPAHPGDAVGDRVGTPSQRAVRVLECLQVAHRHLQYGATGAPRASAERGIYIWAQAGSDERRRISVKDTPSEKR